MENQIKIIVVGGGPAGLSVISAMRQWEKRSKLQITLLEPSDWHYYQSAWLPYSTSLTRKDYSRRHIAQLLSPDEINWINEAAEEFYPSQNYVVTVNGTRIDYDYLVLACGLNTNWDSIRGLHGKLGRDGIASISSYPTLEWTKRLYESFNTGRAIFTHPSNIHNSDGPAKEIAFLMADKLELEGKRGRTDLRYYSGSETLFPVTTCSNILSKHFEKGKIQLRLGKELVEVKPKSKEAIFRDLLTDNIQAEKYDFLHISPPVGPPVAIATSELANSSGFVDVDAATLQHRRFTNVFALGDISSSPIVRNVSAIRFQLPIVVSNIAASILGKSKLKSYDGSTNHMILTAKNRGFWFKCKFNELKVSSLFSNVPKEKSYVPLVKLRASSFFYWKTLLAGRKLPAIFPQSHLSEL